MLCYCYIILDKNFVTLPIGFFKQCLQAGGAAGEVLRLFALVTGGRWHVTGRRWHVTCHMSHVTHGIWDTIFLKKKLKEKEVPEKSQKLLKNAFKKIQERAKKQEKCQKGGMSLYGCYHPHRPRDLLSPICGIIVLKFELPLGKHFVTYRRFCIPF